MIVTVGFTITQQVYFQHLLSKYSVPKNRIYTKECLFLVASIHFVVYNYWFVDWLVLLVAGGSIDENCFTIGSNTISFMNMTINMKLWLSPFHNLQL